MTLFEQLVKRHGKKLTDPDLAVLKNVTRKHRDILKGSWPTQTDADSVAFVKLERIFTQDTVALFGQEAPSLAHSKLIIQRGVENSEGELEAGPEIMSMLMSEQAVTRLLLSTNRGGNDIPATTFSLGETVLPAYEVKENKKDLAFNSSKNEIKTNISKITEALKTRAATGGSVGARKAATEAIDSLKKMVKDHGETSFYLDQRMETYGERRVDMLSEAAHAALHADRIMNAPLLLEAPKSSFSAAEERETNPLLNALLDHYTPEEEEVLRTVMRFEAEWMTSEFGLGKNFFGENFDNWPNSRSFYKISEEDKEHVERTRGVANSVFNSHVCKNRPLLTAHGLGLGVTQVQGWTGFLHSSLPATDSSYFMIRISAAYEEAHFGKSELKGMHHPIVEFVITSDDYMMLLRGHPTGKEIPCTLRAVNGMWQPQPAARENKIATKAKGVVAQMNNDQRTQDLLTALQELSTHMEIKGGTKAWKEETNVKVQHIEKLVENYLNVLDDGFKAGDEILRNGVGDMVKASLEEMRTVLPDSLTRKLLS